MDDSDTSTSMNSFASHSSPAKPKYQWTAPEPKSIDQVVDFFQQPVPPFSHAQEPGQAVHAEHAEPSMSLNLIQLFNDVLLLLTRLIDVFIPQNSTNTLNFLEQTKKNASTGWKQLLAFYKSNSFVVNVSVTILVLSLVPPVLIFVLIMAAYTSFIGFLFTTGLSVLAVGAAIGFLPVFVVSMSLVTAAALTVGLVYLGITSTITVLSHNVPTRDWLSYLADMFPPSVGVVEVKK
ncbi:hypothetical protein OGAPHI_004718 [Ogataea philodendri]|uniref:Transmembrane protein n=1 Tax=Ogataea philodendri TaxID=1378263 RepID=A0A9P8P3H0_9ASCO|nr:uncharacterized protein OGAPHI_004718 [Ogataea philodendri]KAH3664004.1 hypothetical protein OGAPHI_004718 [Ogataea philodendri]